MSRYSNVKPFRFVVRPRMVPTLLQGTAFKTLRDLMPGIRQTQKIEALQDDGKSIVLRFNGVTPEGNAIIAKVRQAGALDFERNMYEEVLPHIPIRTLRYYGFVSEPDSQSDWLFIEDAGNRRYSPLFDAHCVLASQWLGLLHSHRPRAAVKWLLSRDRGLAYHGRALRLARERMTNYLRRPLDKRHAPMLDRVLCHFDLLESRWRTVEQACERIPQGIVHADFKEGNIRIGRNHGSLVILVCDWESAGWGVPIVDLAQFLASDTSLSANPSLTAYWELVQHRWPGFDIRELEHVANLGTIWRALRGISWGAAWLEHEWVQDGVNQIEWYLPIFREAIAKAGWKC